MSSVKSKKRMSWSSHLLTKLPDNVLKLKKPQAGISEGPEAPGSRASSGSMHRLSAAFGASDVSLTDSRRSVRLSSAGSTVSAASAATRRSSGASLAAAGAADAPPAEAQKLPGRMPPAPVREVKAPARGSSIDYHKRRETFMLPKRAPPPAHGLPANGAVPFLTLDLGDQQNLSFPQQFLDRDDEHDELTESTVHTLSSDLTADTSADLAPGDRKSALSFRSVVSSLAAPAPCYARAQRAVALGAQRKAVISRGVYIFDPVDAAVLDGLQLSHDELFNPFVE